MTAFRDRTPWTMGSLFVLLFSAFALAGAQQSSSPDQTPIRTEGPRPVATDGEARALPRRQSGIDLPDAPDVVLEAQQQATSSEGAANPQEQSAAGRQTKRILYVVPNFRAVSADSLLPPQSIVEKFKTGAEDSFDYSSFIFVGVQAGLGQINRSYPEFGNGTVGYGRYYWHTLADATDENLWVEFVIPSALHQDTRYYTLGHGRFARRITYAFTRIVITRNDKGNETFNASEILGAGTAAGMANLYYPGQERTFVKSYQRWVTNVSIDGGVFMFKEFWPDINNEFFHQKD